MHAYCVTFLKLKWLDITKSDCVILNHNIKCASVNKM